MIKPKDQTTQKRPINLYRGNNNHCHFTYQRAYQPYRGNNNHCQFTYQKGPINLTAVTILIYTNPNKAYQPYRGINNPCAKMGLIKIPNKKQYPGKQ